MMRDFASPAAGDPERSEFFDRDDDPEVLSADASSSTGPDVALQPCRRCRKPVAVDRDLCPHCGDKKRKTDAASRQVTPSVVPSEELRVWKTLLVGYAATLVATVLCDLILTESPLVDFADDRSMLTAMSVIEALYSIIVIATWLLLRKLPGVPRPPVSQFIVWPVALIALVAALAANYGYHAFLISLGVRVLELAPKDPAYWPWWIATSCVQPAVIEELFFRGCTWKVLRPAMGLHATVLVSSVMFGMAHIGVALSIPVLMLVGVMLGYARAYSGTIWLPVVLHFLHNLVVTLW